MSSEHKSPQRIGKQELALLGEIRASDMIFGFLTSAGSSTIAHRQARRRAQSRASKIHEKNIIRRLKSLEKKNLIQIETTQDNQKRIQLTNQGLVYARRQELVQSYRSIAQDYQWDGIWRIIMFDIPQEHKAYRWQLRHLLQDCGFVQVQQSVYAAPYPCKELQEYIARNRIIGSYVHLIKGEYVGNDVQLREEFGLKG